jgi:uncharacterized protein HemX
MDRSNWPLLLIEGVLVLGGALLFGWWQLRSVARDQQETARRREAEALRSRQEDEASASAGGASPRIGSGTTDTQDDNRA